MELNAKRIIKALECCADKDIVCDSCPYMSVVLDENESCTERMETDALNLINKLSEENERLNESKKALTDIVKICAEQYKRERADTVREVEKLIAEHATKGWPRKVRLSDVNKVIKKMLERENR